MSRLILGDCEKILKENFSSNCIDLIMTSPPYANTSNRGKVYGGIHPDKYVDWFLPKSEQFLRVLKSNGTFILNIKERVVNAERHVYVINLILEMRKQGWLWTEEFIWHKKTCYPGKWPNRFRDAWERLLQFNKEREFKMFQEHVMLPMGDWAKARLSKLSETDRERNESRTGSRFGRNVSNWLVRGKVYPTNVLYLSPECGNKNQSAVFPKDLPEWFIKLFTQKNDVVLDPFIGSGSTAIACMHTDRECIGIEKNKNNFRMAADRIEREKSR